MKRKKKLRNNLIVLLLPVLLLSVLLIQWSCNRQSGKSYASLNPETQYVGMETCKSCHSDVYETFSHTGMGLSFDQASQKKSSADFSNHAPVFDHFKKLWYYPFWQNDSLRIMEYRIEEGDTVHKLIETINYIVGSGQHTNSHIIERNGYLFQAPLTFYTQKGQWDLPPGFERGRNSRFGRIIGLECMTCHNAYPDFVKGSENKYLKVKTGIDCERCHGPGSQHVKEKREGKLVNTTQEIDYTIVNPSKLPVDLQFDVCQRCHIQGNAVLNEGKSFFDFRPGMKLAEVMNVFMPVYSGAEDEHIMASHAERLKMSRCFLETDKKSQKENQSVLKPNIKSLTCITCHNPHLSVRKTEKDVFNASCKKCHSSKDDSHGCAADKNLLKNELFNCIKCHMPASGATDIPHVRVTDHYIRKPVPAHQQEKIRKFTGIAAINNPNAPEWSRGMAFINYFEKFGFEPWSLDSALKYFPSSNSKETEENLEALIHIHYLKKNYSQVAEYENMFPDLIKRFSKISFDNRHAFTCYRIGFSLENTGHVNKATGYYKQAANLAPLYAEFPLAYAASLTAMGDSSKAMSVYEDVLKEQPFNVRALSNYGFLKLALEGNASLAEAMIRKAIAYDPDYLQAHYNLAGLYLFQNRRTEAESILKKIVQRFPEQQKARMILQSL
ncbi:MAG: tetratricopeptide repeat protein [Bacteroidia bacterium]|nr:tetratricopeptide repeat protein [Bacteroidia bacterium]